MYIVAWYTPLLTIECGYVSLCNCIVSKFCTTCDVCHYVCGRMSTCRHSSFLLPGELNRDPTQNLQYEDVDDTPLGKYLHTFNQNVVYGAEIAQLYDI